MRNTCRDPLALKRNVDVEVEVTEGWRWRREEIGAQCILEERGERREEIGAQCILGAYSSVSEGGASVYEGGARIYGGGARASGGGARASGGGARASGGRQLVGGGWNQTEVSIGSHDVTTNNLH
ncbi:hypothetical protein EYF80_054596 [Liparis tanakae]|uniref:Uncharacterized protein n=1 Tax=Liparis tanakae TaxID=230148 RepID=A0A4Z2F271_9TELE|nr:hypothetical protein EYF80_054596 [Liparis tanakae]